MGPYRQPARAALAVLLVFAAAASLAPPADSSANGAWDARERGCYCHDSLPSVDVGFTVTGLPGRYAGGANYTVELNVTITDVAARPNASQGGFYMEASAGNFSAPPGWEDLLQIRGTQSTHAPNGTRTRQWLVNWTAPPEEGQVVTFYVFVNTVNGDRSETFSRDHWTSRTVRIGVGDRPEVTGPPPGQPPFAIEAYALLPIAGGAALAMMYLMVSAKRSRTGGAPGDEHGEPAAPKSGPPR